MAKKVSCTPRFTASYINFSLESPFSARLPMEKGKAAPAKAAKATTAKAKAPVAKKTAAKKVTKKEVTK